MNINKEKLQKVLEDKRVVVVLFVVLFLVTALGSWALFSFVIKTPRGSGVTSKNVATTRSKIDPSLPKTEVCPINGQKFTTQERAIWEGRRPATVMIENHVDSRPPEGLSKADFVYEAVAEGGITRYLGVFYCAASGEDVKVAPVRSSRVYFINWASEYGDRPLYVHVGGANDFGENGGSKPAGEIDPRVNALGLLEKIGWRTPGGNDYDAGYDAGFPVFFRNLERLGHPIAYEHTMTISSDALYADAEKRGLGFTAKNGIVWTKGFAPYSFTDDSAAGTANASDIKFSFWESESDYNVEWKYDKTSNSYLRFDGGKAHTDLEYNNSQLTAKNVIVMEVKEVGPVDKEMHLIEQNIGSGKATLFQNGTVTPITWTKADRASRTLFTDGNGKQITLVRGVTWVEATPSGNTLTYN